MKYDISIVYRIYPKVSKVPPIYADDKYKLSELCLKSFAAALKGVNAKIWVLLDNCPKEYSELFAKELSGFDYELIDLPGIGNAGTFGKQMDILSQQDDSELVYFAEDDYFYLDDAFQKLIDLFKNEAVDFATPYDHDDIYKLDIHNEKCGMILEANHHWRTSSSTTMTFLTRKETLIKTKNAFRSYTKNNYDASLWFALTGRKLLNPFKFIKYAFTNKMMRNIYLKGLYFLFFETLFGRTYKLYSPVKSLATHMDSEHLAPNINWEKEFSKFAD